MQVCKPCDYALVEAVEPFKLHPMSMSYIYERFELSRGSFGGMIIFPPNYIYSFWVDVNLVGWFFCPPKFHLLVFEVKGVDVIAVGNDMARVSLMFTLVYIQNEMVLAPTWKNNRILNFANWNSDLMSFQHRNSQTNFQPDYPESEMESEFCFQWGSRNQNQKLGFPT